MASSFDFLGCSWDSFCAELDISASPANKSLAPSASKSVPLSGASKRRAGSTLPNSGALKLLKQETALLGGAAEAKRTQTSPPQASGVEALGLRSAGSGEAEGEGGQSAGPEGEGRPPWPIAPSEEELVRSSVIVDGVVHEDVPLFKDHMRQDWLCTRCEFFVRGAGRGRRLRQLRLHFLSAHRGLRFRCRGRGWAADFPDELRRIAHERRNGCRK